MNEFKNYMERRKKSLDTERERLAKMPPPHPKWYHGRLANIEYELITVNRIITKLEETK